MPSFEVRYDDALSMLDESLDKAEADVINMGLNVATRPSHRGEFSDFPKMPEDLSRPGFQELQRLIGQFTEWYGYAIGQLKLAEGARNTAEEKKTTAWAIIRKLKTGTVSDKDDAVRTDARYVRVVANYNYCDTKYRLLVGIVEGLKRDIETISRAATVLESRVGAEGRGVAVSRKGRAEQTAQTFRSGRREGGVLDTFRKGRRR
jgi:hypothetical protein